MKKYLLTFLMALIVGFFLSEFFIRQYNDYNGIKVSNTGDNFYFVQYGVFSNKESMEKNAISLENYVYNIENDMYYVYVGITKRKENAEKIVNYYKNLGYDAIIKEYQLNHEEFSNLINNYDEVLSATDDPVTIASIINQTLMKYEEVVISDGED